MEKRNSPWQETAPEGYRYTGVSPEGEGYSYTGVSLEEAVALILEQISYKKENHIVEVTLEQALGMVTAKDYHAPISQPPFDRSPLDGYALRAKDSTGALRETPVVFSVVEELYAGAYPVKRIEKGTAARIMTGAPIPEGADCVIKQEDTDYGERQVAIYREQKPYDNYCFAGEDFREGDCLIPKDTCLGAVELGILASMGYTRVRVYEKPRIGLFTTGDELVKPGQPLLPGKIYNSNLYVLWGRLKELGIEPVFAEPLPDRPEEVAKTLKELLQRVDVIVTTGGVSVGKKDIMHSALALMGAERIFWRVRIKPGTPTVFAVADGVPVIGLSGNPFGAVTNLELLVRPLLAELTGKEMLAPRRRQALMAEDFLKASPVRRFLRGRYRDGKVSLPGGLHSSGVLGSMRGCNCLIDIPAGNKGLRQSEVVDVILLY